MKKSSIFMAVVTAVAMSAGAAQVEDDNVEECRVIDPKTGKGLIKAFRNSCRTTCKTAADKTDCAGKAQQGDPNAFILVPAGQCVKINAGDFSGVPNDIKDLIVGAK